jgi:RHS repeat-associated protein
MAIQGRKYTSSSSYRYGFNGKENDDETGTIDFGARAYDARLGRWWSIDPLSKIYPDLSPYNFVDNNPIHLIDIDGKRIIITSYNNGIKGQNIEYKNGTLYTSDGKKYTGTDKYVLRVAKALDNLKRMGEVVSGVVGDLEASKNTHVITNNDKKGLEDVPAFSENANYNVKDGKGSHTKFTDPPTADNSDEEVVGHELKHAWNAENNINNSGTASNGKVECEEVDATNFANIIRDKEYKEPKKNHGSNQPIPQNELIPANKYKLQDKKDDR